MTYILQLVVVIYLIHLNLFASHINHKIGSKFKCPNVPLTKPRYYKYNKKPNVKVVYNNQIQVTGLDIHVVCVNITLKKVEQNSERQQTIFVNNLTATCSFNSDFINFMEQYKIEVTLIIKEQEGYSLSKKYETENFTFKEHLSIQCKIKNKLLEISLLNLDETINGYEVFITSKEDPLQIILFNNTVYLRENPLKEAKLSLNISYLQKCDDIYQVMVKKLRTRDPYLLEYLYLPCNRSNSSEYQPNKNLCGNSGKELFTPSVSFLPTINRAIFVSTINQTSFLPTTSTATLERKFQKRSLHSLTLWVLTGILILSFLFCLLLIHRRKYWKKYSQFGEVTKNMPSQTGLVISFPQPMEHCAVTRELTILLNMYTNLRVRSSHEMKLRENQSVKTQLQQVYDQFNTFIIIHSDGLYHHHENKDNNRIGTQMADFTVELVKFCIRDGSHPSKNIYHITFDIDLSNFEDSQLYKSCQANMYNLYKANVFENIYSVDMDQMENLISDINEQQAIINPIRHLVKFQINWKESREIQNLSDTLLCRDNRQKMFPGWYDDMFPRLEINENGSNYNFDLISKSMQPENGCVKINDMNFELQASNLLQETYSYSDNISSDQISELLEIINSNKI